MATALSPEKALSTGSDLWIVADLNHSKWTSKIDWYLNFQIVKASRHESPQVSDFLKEALQQTGLPAPQVTVGKGPLLIQSEFLLPNKWVLVLPFEEDLKNWMTKVAEIWNGLQKPSVRIFLPTGQTSSPQTAAWFEKLEFQNCSLVLDLSN